MGDYSIKALPAEEQISDSSSDNDHSGAAETQQEEPPLMHAPVLCLKLPRRQADPVWWRWAQQQGQAQLPSAQQSPLPQAPR
jgi:hypothetical protein